MKLCPKCQKHFSDDANFCPVDAARLIPLEAPAAGTDSLAAKFKLGERIGGGRTGTVYRATDVASGGAAVVKIVAPSVVGLPGVGARLERELKQLERVQSAGVAKVLASGKRNAVGIEETWLAYELLDGAQTLAEAISARGPIPLAQAAHLIEVVGEALIEAAQVGVVHRDLAPKNVLFSSSASGDIKLINFSLPVPTTEKVPGVPEFVAPEQVDGKAVDQRSNLYSLGALYYYVLTGQPVHTGPAEEVHRAHVNAVIQPPSTITAVPQAVEAVIMRALDRSPTKRFLTVRQFVDEVSRIARGEADPKSTQPLGKVGRPKAELVQTLLGVRGLGEGASPPPVGPGSAPVSVANLAGSAPASVVVSPSLAAPSQPRGPDMPAPLAPQPAQPVVGAGTIGPGAGQAALDKSPWAPPSAQVPTPLPPQLPPASVTLPPEQPSAAAIAMPAMHAAAAQAAMSDAMPAVKPSAVAAAAVQPPAVPSAPSIGSTTAAGKKKPGAAAPEPPTSGKSKKGKFRETMWFKKGELDSDTAVASAADREATGRTGGNDKVDSMPIDDRYKDDGSITRGDAEKYSLRTGGTQMMASIKDSKTSGSMSSVPEDALIGEMKGGRRIWLALIGVGIIGVGLLIYLLAS